MELHEQILELLESSEATIAPNELPEFSDAPPNPNALPESADAPIDPNAPPTAAPRQHFDKTYIWTEKGVHGCEKRLDQVVQFLVDNHAAVKSKETGLVPIWKGHLGGRYWVRHGKFWDGARWCTITVELTCRVVF